MVNTIPNLMSNPIPPRRAFTFLRGNADVQSTAAALGGEREEGKGTAAGCVTYEM